jgi:hypothetical protein
MEQLMEPTSRRSGPHHLQFRELVLVLLFPLIAPYWIAAMIGRNRWRAICEAAGAVIAGVVGPILFIWTFTPLEASFANNEAFWLIMLVGAVLAYCGAGYVFWSSSHRPVPTWLKTRLIPGLSRWWGAGLSATLAVAAAVVWHTGHPQVLAYTLYDLYWEFIYYLPLFFQGVAEVTHLLAIDIPVEATFNMAGQQAWLATLVWLTVTVGPAIMTMRTYRVEEKRLLQAA